MPVLGINKIIYTDNKMFVYSQNTVANTCTQNKPVEFSVHLRNIKIKNISIKNIFSTLLNK